MSTNGGEKVDLPAITAKFDQRVAELRSALPHGVSFRDLDCVLIQLTEPPPFATPQQIKEWDHTCDLCGKVGPLYTGSRSEDLLGTRIVVTFGICPKCAGKEE